MKRSHAMRCRDTWGRAKVKLKGAQCRHILIVRLFRSINPLHTVHDQVPPPKHTPTRRSTNKGSVTCVGVGEMWVLVVWWWGSGVVVVVVVVGGGE